MKELENMLEQELKKAEQFIKEAANITVLASPQFQGDSFPAALALFYILKNLGKNVNFIAKTYPERFRFLVNGDIVNSASADFSISIQERRLKITDLSYQKTEDGLKLFLKTNGRPLSTRDVSLKSMASDQPEDLFVAIGLDKLEETEKFLKEPDSPIINIDNQASNQSYGEVNLVDTQAATISEIIFDLACQFNDKKFNELQANSLLAGIIYGSQNFQNDKITSQTFEKISCLHQFGKSIKEIKQALYGHLAKGSLEIFAKILNKLSIRRDLNLASALVSQRDFKETTSSIQDLSFALRKLTSGLFPFQNVLILWEEKNSPLLIRGVFYSLNRGLRKKIAESFQAGYKGEGLLLETKESDLLKTEEKILKIIREEKAAQT